VVALEDKKDRVLFDMLHRHVLESLEEMTDALQKPTILRITGTGAFSVLETCSSGVEAMQTYRRIHKQYPNREFYFVHTSREELNIHEIQWYGIRSRHAINAYR
jgi:hypothetical protein